MDVGVGAAGPRRALRRLPGRPSRGDGGQRRGGRRWRQQRPGRAGPAAARRGTRPTSGRPSRRGAAGLRRPGPARRRQRRSTTRAGWPPRCRRSIRDGLTVDGKQYGVPTSAHRGNVLFFNQALLAKAGVAEPGADYDADDLPRRPRQAGAGRRHAAVPGRQGPVHHHARCSRTPCSAWSAPTAGERIADDRFDWNGAPVDQALSQFGQILDYADPQAAGLTWDAATKKLADGGCAFETMNDSAFGELVNAGARRGHDLRPGALPRHRRTLRRRGRHLRPGRASPANTAQRRRLPGRARRAGDAARLQQGQGLGAGPHRRRRLVADALPAVGRGRRCAATRCSGRSCTARR